LDVGCGFGKWGNLLTTNYWETENPKKDERPFIVGCDGYLPNVEMARNNSCYSEVKHIHFPPLPFDDLSFDTILMIEIIEHLEIEEGLFLIKESKRVTRNRVILSTPGYPDYREAHETITGLNPLDSHKSYWSRSRLRSLGFQLYGAGWKPGSRYLRGILRRMKLLKLYDRHLRPAFSSLSLLFPYAAENIIGLWMKDIDD